MHTRGAPLTLFLTTEERLEGLRRLARMRMPRFSFLFFPLFALFTRSLVRTSNESVVQESTRVFRLKYQTGQGGI